ncbi:RHS repeat-associated core domain-containing protein [Archangium violaceum]|uniref:RHS repeat-associated core domain-containing protein n=1 Tax=Archangium violaceum TaxID=83451 RepID=UPI0037C00D62
MVSPYGPDVLFTRTYSTHWAQSRGGRDEIGRLGPGWTDTYGARLVLDGNTPAQQVTYRKADTGTENFTRQPDGTYTGRLPGRRLSFDTNTQRWVLEKFDASYEVFDTIGRLAHLRAPDGGEAHLVYTGQDAACPADSTRPAGALCRVDFLFGHQLWMRYHSTAWPGAPRLASVAWDAAGTRLLAQYAYDTGGYLVTATQADNRQETYAYGFTHAFPRHPGATVKLLTSARDGTGALVESFTYEQLRLSQSRVRTHETPEGRYTFIHNMRSSGGLERITEVRSTRENLRFTWEGGKLKTVCHLDGSSCDMTRMKELTVPVTGILAPTCERGFDGYFTRYLRDSMGRRISTLKGLVDCNNPTAQEALHEVVQGYVANSNRLAYTSRASVDTTAPAGTTTFTVYDYTSPASAIDPLCGNASCQVPTAYNTPASALTPLVRQRVQVGRTLANTSGAWETRVEVTKYTYSPEGLLLTENGPRTDVDDTLTYEYYDVLGPSSTAGQLKKVWQGTRLLAEYQDYTDRSQPRRVLDGNGQATLYTYDASDRILTVQGPDDAQPTVFTYSAGGKRQSVTMPLGNRILYTYDTSGRLTSVGQTATPTGIPATFDEEIKYEWGPTTADSGRLLRESYLREGLVVRTTTYDYDTQGRKAEVRHLRVEEGERKHAAVRLTTFNEKGDIVDTRVGISSDTSGDELEDKTTYLYDNLQRLTRASGNSGIPRNFLYDVHDNVTEVNEVYDPQFVTSYPQTKYRYDDFGRLVEVSSTTFGTRRYVYDLAGNRVQELLPTGQVLTSTYDASGRLTAISGSDYSATFTYDTNTAATVLDCATGTALGVSYGVGRLTSVAEASGTTYFGYTPGGKPRFEARLAPGATCAKTMHWDYDGNGNTLAVRYPSGARVRYEYPVGTAHMHVPSSVTLEVGGTSIPLATDLSWSAGDLTDYTAGNGLLWRFSRWLDGSPREWKVSRRDEYDEETVIRSRVFGEEANGTLEPRLDGRGSPLRIEEDMPAWTRGYTYQEGSGFVETETQSTQETTYIYSSTGMGSDRSYRMTMPVPLPPNGMYKEMEFYDIDETSFRLTESSLTEVTSSTSYNTTTRKFTYAAGGQVTQVNTNNRLLALCYDSREQVASVVGAGGQYSRQQFNFRRQRVREVWPLNGLVTDYWVGGNGALLMEAGAASLTAQYPRPVWEYVYVGGQPIARIDSTEAANGTTTYQETTWLFGGHLGELLVEADSGGHVVRNYDYTLTGARQARTPPALQPEFGTLSRFFPATQVRLPSPASAVLRFEGYSLAPCDSVVVMDEQGNMLKRLSPTQPAQFETEVLPAQGTYLQVMLMQGACAGSSSLTLAEVKPAWGRARETLVTGHASPNPYPPAGFSTTLTLPPNTHLLVESFLATCDTLEVRRTGTGEVLWTWPYDSGFFRSAWTPAFSGSVDVGIWSTQGCNQTQQQSGFVVRRSYTRLPPGTPSNLHLPGQRALSAAAATRRGAFLEPEPDLLENWFRTYMPAIGRYLQPEPLATNPNFVMSMALRGHDVSAYAYANNAPLTFVDPDALYIRVTGTPTPDRIGDGHPSCNFSETNANALTCLNGDTYKVGEPTPCKERCENGKSTWSFDINIDYSVYINFRQSNSSTKSVYDEYDKGMTTVGQHELKHVADIQSDLSEATVNGKFQTEGFESQAACEQARGSIRRPLLLYRDQVRKSTHEKRDRVKKP